MKVLCAPDSYKECMSAISVAEIMTLGCHDAATTVEAPVEVDCCPIADGGDGTVHTLVAATGGQVRQADIIGPLGDPIRASWGRLGDGKTAVIEVAQACGLHLVPSSERDPTRTTSYGVGQLIKAALDDGCRTIVIGLGGSATTDGGAGMASALGARFEGVPEHVTGGDLRDIRTVDLSGLDPRIAEAEIRVACDVNNPLYGDRGAAAVYGPQKGATPEQVEVLDAGLRHWASMVKANPTALGAGAAGGLGFALLGLLKAPLEPGVDLVLDAVGFDDRCRGVDLVLTGEGKLDGQSLQGKACHGVARRAKALGVPTVAIIGTAGYDVQESTDPRQGGELAAWRSIVDAPMTLQEAMQRGPQLLRHATEQVVRQWLRAKMS
jgi:glycerate kinase